MLNNPERPINMGLKKMIAEEGAINRIGALAACYGQKAFIIGGTTALSKAIDQLKTTLDEANVSYFIREFKGFCSKKSLEMLQTEALKYGANLLIAVGGGSVMDTVKAVGYWLKLPVITVPTIVATCAAWAPLSVMYTEEHFPDGGLNTYAPEYVICDYSIIKDNPRRFFAAGLGDSLAKWPELGVAGSPTPCYASGVSLAAHIYKECLDLASKFAKHSGPPINDIKLLGAIIDQVVILTGLSSELTSGAMGGSDYPLVAHGVDNALLCYSHKSHEFLHGERVSFGILPHLLISNAPKVRVEETMRFLVTLGLPTKLEDFGLSESDIPHLSQKIYDAPGISNTGVKIETIVRALEETRLLPWDSITSGGDTL